MGRYSPTVVPNVPDPSETIYRAMQGYLGFGDAARADRYADMQERNTAINEERSKREAESYEADLYQQGFRRFDRQPVVEQAARPPEVFRGQQLGMGLVGGAVSPLATAIQQQQQSSQPVALPGEFVPGMGFTTRTIYPAPGDLGRRAMQGTVSAPDPRYENVTGDLYVDTENTPEARAARSAEAEAGKEAERVSQLAQLLMQHPEIDPTEANLLARDVDLPDEVVFPSLEPPRAWQPTTFDEYKERESFDASLGRPPTLSEQTAASRERRIAEEGRRDRQQEEAAAYAQYFVDTMQEATGGDVPLAAILANVQAKYPDMDSAEVVRVVNEAMQASQERALDRRGEEALIRQREGRESSGGASSSSSGFDPDTWVTYFRAPRFESWSERQIRQALEDTGEFTSAQIRLILARLGR